MDLGERIDRARLDAGLSRRRLAARMERSPETLRRWVEGITSPKWKDLEAVARVCGVPLSFLTHEHDGEGAQDCAPVQGPDSAA